VKSRFILLMMIAFVCLFQFACLGLVGPTDPDNPVPVKVEIKVDYYRVDNNGRPDGQDKARIGCSWEGSQTKEMQKIEENHFFYQSQRIIEAPTLQYQKDEYKLSIQDLMFSRDIAEDVYVNGKKLVLTRQELGMLILLFWVDAKGQIITVPQGN